VGVGDLLRQEIQKGTELGRESEAVMKAGGASRPLSTACVCIR
jgi:adenylate kinase family enzyme